VKACDRPPRTAAIPDRPAARREQPREEPCDICGNDAVEWRKCKLVCTACGTILKSCADL
jgi:hypothetical protein